MAVEGLLHGTPPYFSVIIPCFNRLEPLRRTLESLYRQSTTDFEVVVVDDCGQLDVGGVVAELSALLTERGQTIRLIRLEQNGGPAHARNVGWEHARGNYVAFLDSDDIWHPEKLRIAQAILSKYNVDAMYHPHSMVDTRDAYVPIALSQYACKYVDRWRWLFRNHATTSCFVLKRAIEERFDESMRYAEDYDLWLRVLQRHRMLAVNGPPLTLLGRPSMTSGGLSSHRWKMRAGECKMYWKYCRHSPFIVALPLFLAWVGLKHVRALVKRPLMSAS
jgi:glycosyltransferase involved in cell wall biosynthesis